VTSGGICHNLEGSGCIACTPGSPRDNHVVSPHALCRDFEFGSDRYDVHSKSVQRQECREHDKPKPGGQNFCHPIFYVLYNSRAGILKKNAQGMKKNPLNIPTN